MYNIIHEQNMQNMLYNEHYPQTYNLMKIQNNIYPVIDQYYGSKVLTVLNDQSNLAQRSLIPTLHLIPLISYCMLLRYPPYRQLNFIFLSHFNVLLRRIDLVSIHYNILVISKGRMFMHQKTIIYAVKNVEICFKICLIKRHYMPKKVYKICAKILIYSKKCKNMLKNI